MNAVEQVLESDINDLLDRLTASVPDGCLRVTSTRHPALLKRLDEAETQLSGLRSALLDSYGRWRRALEDTENLWALAAYRVDQMGSDALPTRSAPEQALEPARSIAA
jgi:hypothetical protein